MAYHFFKRPRRNRTGMLPSSEELSDGLRILESILRFGLLLKPEKMPYHPARPVIAPRICLTEASIDALSERKVSFDGKMCNHFEIFGPFAIGFDSNVARRLGMSAVIYHATDEGGGSLFDHLSESLIQIYNVLTALSHVQAVAYPPGTCKDVIDRDRLRTAGVDFAGESTERIKAFFHQLHLFDAEQVSAWDDLIGKDRWPFWYQAQLVGFLIDMFQDADSSRQTDKRHLAFYRQHEWRILRAYHGRVLFVPLSGLDAKAYPITPKGVEYRNEFLRFWGSDYIPDRDWLLAADGDDDVRSLIAEIVYPDCLKPQLYAMIDRVGCDLKAVLTPYCIEEKFETSKPKASPSNEPI